MCLNVISGTTRRVAQKDFFVYKRLKFNDESPYQDTKYIRNKTYKLGKEIRQSNGAVNAGFHAYLNIGAARAGLDYDEKIVPMIVPKGTRYYVGDGQEIASETIKTIALDDVK